MRQETQLKARALKDRLYEQFARLGKAVSSPQRLELIEHLAQGERTVDALAKLLGLPIANASHHLQALRAARLVEARREGTFIHYRLADPEVFELVRLIRTLSERHLAEVDGLARTFFAGRDELEPVQQEELLRLARAGEVIVLDVRPEAEYRAGHIAGALSVPLRELQRRLRELPRKKQIVAYCRGPYCVLSLDAVQLLRASGRRVRRLADGFPEWRAAGLPVGVASTQEEESP